VEGADLSEEVDSKRLVFVEEMEDNTSLCPCALSPRGEKRPIVLSAS
jgi:hypothetical protein